MVSEHTTQLLTVVEGDKCRLSAAGESSIATCVDRTFNSKGQANDVGVYSWQFEYEDGVVVELRLRVFTHNTGEPVYQSIPGTTVHVPNNIDTGELEIEDFLTRIDILNE